MRRAPFVVLVLPYTVELDGEVSYAVFRGPSRRDAAWHALVGEGVRGETPLEAARREAWRIAELPPDALFLELESRTQPEPPEGGQPVVEHVFAVRVLPDEVRPRRPRLALDWVSYDIAKGRLQSQADRDALAELRRRIGRSAACA
jgi:hypothetical protein